MSRSIRLEHPGAIWHITSRGNERREIYRSDSDRLLFLEIVGHVVELHHWIVYAWVLMSNHYHLLVETPVPTLSVGSKRLNELYAQAFNLRHQRVGHLFQGRFKAILVERETHYLELLRYIVLNPVRCGAARFAGEYEWSSYRETAGLCASSDWLATDEVLAEFGPGSRAERRERYRRFVADGRGATYNPWEQLTGQIYLGGEAFCKRMQSLVGIRREVRAYPQAQRTIVRPSLETIVRLVSSSFAEPEERLLRRSHHPARKALAQLAWQETGLSLGAIGTWMNITDRAVCHLVKCGIKLEASDAGYAERVTWLRRQLQAVVGEPIES